MNLEDYTLKGNQSNKYFYSSQVEPISPFLGIKGDKFGVGFFTKKNLCYFYGKKISGNVNLFQALKAVQVLESLNFVENNTPEYCWKISSDTVGRKNISEITNRLFPSGDCLPEKIVSLVKRLSPSTTFLIRSLRFACKFKLKINIDRAISELDAETKYPYQLYSLKDLMWGENTRFYTTNLDTRVTEMSLKRQILKHLQKYRTLDEIENVIALIFAQTFVPLDINGVRPSIYLRRHRKKIELVSVKFEDEEFILKIKICYCGKEERFQVISLTNLLMFIQD